MTVRLAIEGAASQGTGQATVERSVATVVLFTLGLGLVFHIGMSYGDVLALLTLPMWVSSFARYRAGLPIAGLLVATAVTGLVLSEVSAVDHVVDAAGRRDTTVELMHLLLCVGVVLWARRLMSNGRIAICFGFGLLVTAIATPSEWSTNAWKYAFAVPVAVLVLGLINGLSRPLVACLVLAALAAISVVLDSRAYSAALALCLVLVLWRSSARVRAAQTSRVQVAALIAALTAAAYLLATNLLVSGYLGRDAQARTIAQIHTSGSLILGGRPELAATFALIAHRPQGYGVGVIPTSHDVLVAKGGLERVGYDPNNGYVDKFMFGGHIELHSVFGDAWANWGLAGLATVAVVAFLALRSVVEAVAFRTGDVITIYACCWTLWNLGFSPLPVSVPILALAVAFSLHPRTAVPDLDAAGRSDLEPER